jgi:hypothetical protein
MLIERTLDPDLPSPKQQARARRRWHAVMIVVRADGCAAAQACKGKRFLSTEAPRVPLEGCDARECECRYRHYEDRRGPPRRRDDATAGATARTDRNRRGRVGRRSTDV